MRDDGVSPRSIFVTNYPYIRYVVVSSLFENRRRDNELYNRRDGRTRNVARIFRRNSITARKHPRDIIKDVEKPAKNSII